MKYIWEKDDLKGSWGGYVKADKHIEIEGLKGLENMYKLGGDGAKPCLICMGDGLVFHYEDYKHLLEHLNDEQHGFRPLRRDELIEAIKYNWDKHGGV